MIPLSKINSGFNGNGVVVGISREATYAYDHAIPIKQQCRAIKTSPGQFACHFAIPLYNMSYRSSIEDLLNSKGKDPMNQASQQEENRVLPDVRTFPIEGTNLARILSDPQYRQSFHAQLKRYNSLVAALYKIGLLPMFGASRTVMLLTTRGRKSGKLRSTPIGYWRIGGDIYLFSAWGRATNWYKNMVACPEDVWIQIGMRRWAAQPFDLKDPDEIMRTIAQFVTESAGSGSLPFWLGTRQRPAGSGGFLTYHQPRVGCTVFKKRGNGS